MVEALIDIVRHLECLLRRSDLTAYERRRYKRDFLRLTKKCWRVEASTAWNANGDYHPVLDIGGQG